MKMPRPKIRLILAALLQNKVTVGLFLLLFIIFIINTLHFSYPDEFDNITGGYFINQGRLPYTGFFTHHGPFAYFFASAITLFGGASFVNFRIILAIVYFCMFLGFFIYLRRRFGMSDASTFLGFSLFVGVASTYYWIHMLLADTLAGMLLGAAYIILLLLFIKQERVRMIDAIILAVLISTGLLTSVTYIFAVCILYLAFVYLVWSRRDLFSIRGLKLLGVLAIPYVIFLIYLVVTRSLGEFYYQAIFFNQQYYVTLPDQTPATNPIRFAVVIFAQFVDHYRALLISIKDMNLGSPLNSTFALANILLIVFLLTKRRFLTALFIVGIMIYVNARSNPFTSMETDYQANAYNLFSMFNGIYLLSSLWKELQGQVANNKRFLYNTSLLVLGVFYFYSALFLFSKGFEKAYLKYMGQQSLIYDRPAVASTLSRLITNNDYYYIGPFAFEDHLYMKAKLSSRYFITIPAMDKSDKIKSELMADIAQHPPKVAVFNTELYIFGHAPGLFLLDYLRSNYFTVEDLKKENPNLKVNIGKLGDYDFERHFFFSNLYREELINKLKETGLISDAS